ncbi:glycosyltransferase family 4 protein [Candidatus Woesearchaeota archaeon]|nr:glycosyltransferase family 4 protein [Candidatus Woesearchaeota archaeon]
MHIAIISSFYGKNLGGAEISTSLLVKALEKQGHKVSIITLNKSPYNYLFNNFPTNLLRLNSRIIDYIIYKKSRSILKKLKPDLVHLNDLALLPAIKAANKLKIKSIITVRDIRFLCTLGDCGKSKSTCSNFPFCLQKRLKSEGKPSFLAFLLFPFLINKSSTYRHYLSKATKLITISNFLKQHINHPDIEVIYNPVPEWPLKTTSNKTPVIFAPGRLDEQKGIQTLIKALPLVNKKTKTIILGQGPYESKLKNLAKKFNLDIEFHARVPFEKIKDYYLNSDIIAFTTMVPEGMGRISIEAFAAKKPLIATNIGAVPEVVDKAGILIERGNPQQLADAINLLLENLKLRQELAENGYKRYKELFTETLFINKHQKLYESMLYK